MKDFLKVGQKFQFNSMLPSDLILVGNWFWHEENIPPNIDFNKLEFDREFEKSILWTERKNGWKRNVITKLNVAAPAVCLKQEWKVKKVILTGGSSGHGLGDDDYPDGYFVTSIDNENRILTFYQSGCFNFVITPEMIDLVE